MSYVIKESDGFKQVAAAVYPARCVRLIGLGTQRGEWAGKPTKKIQVLISFELPTELIPDGEFAGQPYMVSRFYTSSLGEKANLRKHLISWRGRDFTPEELQGFDMSNIVGKPCMVSIIHNAKGKATVDSVMALPKGMTVPQQVNESLIFNIFQWDQDIFDGLSDGIKGIIMKSDEYKFMHGDPGFQVNESHDDSNDAPNEGEIPF